jgi:PKD repeat protein
MMGKGQAFVALDGSGSSDPDGRITDYEWGLGDGNTDSGQKLTYGYSTTGVFTTTLTVTDNCGATATDEAQVTVVGPTPPATAAPHSFPYQPVKCTPAAERPPSSGSEPPVFATGVQRVTPYQGLPGIPCACARFGRR